MTGSTGVRNDYEVASTGAPGRGPVALPAHSLEAGPSLLKWERGEPAYRRREMMGMAVVWQGAGSAQVPPQWGLVLVLGNPFGVDVVAPMSDPCSVLSVVWEDP